jgi:hypothetical protein
MHATSVCPFRSRTSADVRPVGCSIGCSPPSVAVRSMMVGRQRSRAKRVPGELDAAPHRSRPAIQGQRRQHPVSDPGGRVRSTAMLAIRDTRSLCGHPRLGAGRLTEMPVYMQHGGSEACTIWASGFVIHEKCATVRPGTPPPAGNRERGSPPVGSAPLCGAVPVQEADRADDLGNEPGNRHGQLGVLARELRNACTGGAGTALRPTPSNRHGGPPFTTCGARLPA